MSNAGLASVRPPIDDQFGVLDKFQALPAIPGVNAPNKGYNEFVLYADMNTEN